MPSLNTLINGRTGNNPLPGPLAQLGLGRDGTFFVVAAGRAIHAGAGKWQNVVNGNSNFIGIEAENTGLPNDSPWPDVQMDAYRRGVAAILKRIGQDAIFCAGHKEYALPHGRKPDPDFDMEAFRSGVLAILNDTAPAPILIPAAEPPAQPGAPAGRPTLRRGATGDLAKQVQSKVGVIVDGNFGRKTEAALRAFQRAHALVPDGIVGPKTWRALDQAPVLSPIP
jgi:peptidoglycan hydrolase-like protein with peptidoglycan-binding domain